MTNTFILLIVIIFFTSLIMISLTSIFWGKNDAADGICGGIAWAILITSISYIVMLHLIISKWSTVKEKNYECRLETLPLQNGTYYLEEADGYYKYKIGDSLFKELKMICTLIDVEESVPPHMESYCVETKPIAEKYFHKNHPFLTKRYHLYVPKKYVLIQYHE